MIDKNKLDEMMKIADKNGVDEQTVNGIMKNLSDDNKKKVNEILNDKEKLNKILASNTNKDIKIIEKDTDRDNYMSSIDALNYGIIDKVL